MAMPPSLSLGEHTGSPQKPLNTQVFVGADLRVCPYVSALNLINGIEAKWGIRWEFCCLF